ncbi:GNAT family N-acetyltransferase [Qipengyuania sp. 6D47A]|uniref:GNAT family N-acetyltransferase n=2 Tax=Qipengyuania qiaonensis TaxID=2867240 RepID=A0ABS7J0U0_9SPHN|nr:GNAT family N-acetyltransferase [Qipengyuania qiaonensis]
MRIARADLADPAVRAMIEYHQRDMLAVSPPGTSFALDVSGLSGSDVTLIAAWAEDQVVGIGAMKRLSPLSAELKSMRTHPDHLGKGVASAILEELIAEARRGGIARLSLETGTSAEFVPAIRLYLKRGFAVGEPFSDYVNGPHNQCYHLELAAA